MGLTTEENIDVKGAETNSARDDGKDGWEAT